MFNLFKKKGPAPQQQATAAPVQPRPMMIAVVFDKHGRPKLDADFVANMSPVVRVHVNNRLLARGFKLTDTAPFYTEA